MVDNERNVENLSEVTSDSDLFTAEVHRDLSEREVFVGDEDFYRLLTSSTPIAKDKRSVRKKHSVRLVSKNKHFSSLQKVFVAGIIVIEAMLLYIVLKPLFWSTKKVLKPVARQTSPYVPQVVDAQQVRQLQQPVPSFASVEPLSLEIANNFYLQNDYSKAYEAYNQLYLSLSSDADQELIRDFMQLKMALCLNKKGNKEQAVSLFRIVSQSRSPVIRVISNYELCFLQMQEKQYLKARTRAYKTIAMLSAVDFNKNWIFSIQRDCNFLIAESMSRNILLLCDAETDIQSLLWTKPLEIDPFKSLDEGQLREFLIYGSEQLKQGLLSPQIREIEQQNVMSRWSVIAYGASIEELLTRFVSNAGLDITWVLNNLPVDVSLGNAVRKRPVSIYLISVTAPQAIEIALGHVGLLSHIDEKGLVKIYNPDEYSSLSEHINLLVPDTIMLWRNFLLAFPGDQRVPNAHFALGLLYTLSSQFSSAIAEYKLLANQFSQSDLAPYALLKSSKLKADLHDYSGARNDLTQLVEQYPDTEFYGQACLNLADATKNAGFLNEAERLYRKVYNLGLSSKLQIASSLGAGICSFEIKDYENAAKWLIRYLKINKTKDENFFLAYFLLGKTNLAMENPQQAITAFQYALSGPIGSLSRERYVETVSALVETHIRLENFVEALTLLETLDSWQFSKNESYELLLLKSKVLRLMGLPDKAVLILGDNAEYLPDSKLKTRMSFELANCFIAKGNLDFAREILTDILINAEPGPLVQEITLTLAQVCLDLRQSSQTVILCLQILDSDISEQIKQKTQKLLASAYNQQKKFEDAALVLSGKW